MFLGGPVEMVICRGLGELGLRPPDGLGRVLPDFASGKAVQFPAPGLCHQLGAVGPLDAHILMLILINLAVDKAVSRPPGGPGDLPHRPFGFGRFLLCQLVPGLVQLGLPLFHAEFCAVDLFRFALRAEFPAAVPWDTLSHTGPGLLGRRRPPARRPGAFGSRLARLGAGGGVLVLKAQPGRRALAGLGMLRLRRPVRGEQVCPALQWGRALRHWLGAVPLGGGILPALRLRRGRGLPHLPGGRLFPIRAALPGCSGLRLPARPKPQGIRQFFLPFPVIRQPGRRALSGLPAPVTLPAHSSNPPGGW